MVGFAASLLGGPSWRTARQEPCLGLWAAAPLLLFALFVAVAVVAGLPTPVPGWAVVAGHVLSLAVGATLACLLVALPVVLIRPGWVWLLPAWVGLGPALAGASLILQDTGPFASIARAAILSLPVAVFCLAGSWADGSPVSWQAAAGSGAGRFATLRHVVLPLAWRGLLTAGAAVLILAIGVCA